jgi:hypothetical protein
LGFSFSYSHRGIRWVRGVVGAEATVTAAGPKGTLVMSSGVPDGPPQVCPQGVVLASRGESAARRIQVSEFGSDASDEESGDKRRRSDPRAQHGNRGARGDRQSGDRGTGRAAGGTHDRNRDDRRRDGDRSWHGNKARGDSTRGRSGDKPWQDRSGTGGQRRDGERSARYGKDRPHRDHPRTEHSRDDRGRDKPRWQGRDNARNSDGDRRTSRPHSGKGRESGRGDAPYRRNDSRGTERDDRRGTGGKWSPTGKDRKDAPGRKPGGAGKGGDSRPYRSGAGPRREDGSYRGGGKRPFEKRDKQPQGRPDRRDERGHERSRPERARPGDRPQDAAPIEPTALTELAGQDTGAREPVRDEVQEQVGESRQALVLPEEAEFTKLDMEARRELLSLPKPAAELVGRHLVAAGMLLDEDPEQALAHARYARERASRIVVVREAAGLAAYHAGEWAEALSDLRAVRRMSGSHTHIAVMADCERALGRPERALDLAKEAPADLPTEVAVELRIVVAGARRDLGQLDAAVVALQGPDLDVKEHAPWSARLFYAYADNLAAAGRLDEAIRWFLTAAQADDDEETDAAERAVELGAALP